MTPREAYSKRLERRIRAMVRAELATAADVDSSVDNSVDNPSRIAANPGGLQGGTSTVGFGGIPPPLDNPRIRNPIRRRGGKLTEAELMRGYGLAPEFIDLEERGS
jgi:hypothetical protein